MPQGFVFDSRPPNLTKLVLAVAAILLTSVDLVLARPDGLRLAVEFLHATFPQLHQDRELWISASVDGKYEPFWPQTVGVFVVPPGDVDRARRAKTISDAEDLLLQAYVRLDSLGQIQTVDLRGRAVHSAENRSFAQQVQIHEEWTQSDVLEQLRAMGAQCVNEQQVLSHLPLEAWRPMFGALKVRDVRFDNPQERHTGTRGDVYRWEILLDSRARPPRRYAVTVEPVGGTVNHIGKTSRILNCRRSDDLTATKPG